jgi:predicted dehydrogenase
MFSLPGAAAFVTVVAAVAAGGNGAPAAETNDAPVADPPADRLRIAVIGLVHGHVEGLLARAAAADADLEIVGIHEPDRSLFDRLAAKYGLDPALHHRDLPAMLDAVRPECASVMTSIRDHLPAVRAAAPRGVHLLVEKPLAFSDDDARAMADLARRHRIHLLTNYETNWYASVREAKRLVDAGGLAPVRRMIFRHGHRGPREIGCAPEFVAWLTDPAASGGGALVDFGCYGAILATWLMDGRRPTAVVAGGATLKPGTYPRVDDDATIVLTYPGASATIQASWAWTHDVKEMDVFTERGSIHAGRRDDLTVREPDRPPRVVEPAPLPAPLRDEWAYFKGVVRGTCAVDPLSSLEYNLVAVEILDAARRQVAGR